jgi:hypothetical protein
MYRVNWLSNLNLPCGTLPPVCSTSSQYQKTLFLPSVMVNYHSCVPTVQSIQFSNERSFPTATSRESDVFPIFSLLCPLSSRTVVDQSEMQGSDDDESTKKEKVEKEVKDLSDEAQALEELKQMEGTEFRYVCLFGFAR